MMAGIQEPLRERSGSLVRIRSLFRIRLMDHTFVSVSGGTRFVCINARDDQEFVLKILLYSGKTAKIIHHGFLIVSGAGSDDNDKFAGFTGKYFADFFIFVCLYFL